MLIDKFIKSYLWNHFLENFEGIIEISHNDKIIKENEDKEKLKNYDDLDENQIFFKCKRLFCDHTLKIIDGDFISEPAKNILYAIAKEREKGLNKLESLTKHGIKDANYLRYLM